jgi:hypothetical protein
MKGKNAKKRAIREIAQFTGQGISTWRRIETAAKCSTAKAVEFATNMKGCEKSELFLALREAGK